MKIERNAKVCAFELNDLLSTIGWAIDPVEKLEKSLDFSWGWITARDKENLVGFVQILSDGIRHAYILRLIVHKEYQCKGIGTEIVKSLMELLEINNLSPILITKPSEELFYNKFGLDRTSNGFISLLKWNLK